MINPHPAKEPFEQLRKRIEENVRVTVSNSLERPMSEFTAAVQRALQPLVGHALDRDVQDEVAATLVRLADKARPLAEDRATRALVEQLAKQTEEALR